MNQIWFGHFYYNIRFCIRHGVCLQVLELTSGNVTQRLHCLLPFISLRKLMSDLDGETVLRHISLFKYMPWSHQQV